MGACVGWKYCSYRCLHQSAAAEHDVVHPRSNVSVFLRARAYALRRLNKQAAVLGGREAERSFEGVAEMRLM